MSRAVVFTVKHADTRSTAKLPSTQASLCLATLRQYYPDDRWGPCHFRVQVPDPEYEYVWFDIGPDTTVPLPPGGDPIYIQAVPLQRVHKQKAAALQRNPYSDPIVGQALFEARPYAASGVSAAEFNEPALQTARGMQQPARAAGPHAAEALRSMTSGMAAMLSSVSSRVEAAGGIGRATSVWAKTAAKGMQSLLKKASDAVSYAADAGPGAPRRAGSAALTKLAAELHAVCDPQHPAVGRVWIGIVRPAAVAANELLGASPPPTQFACPHPAWMWAGFQGPDPIRDTRGTGTLGMTCLAALADADDRWGAHIAAKLARQSAASQVAAEHDSAVVPYPFALAALNLTARVAEVLGVLPSTAEPQLPEPASHAFWSHRSPPFQRVHEAACRFWDQQWTANNALFDQVSALMDATAARVVHWVDAWLAREGEADILDIAEESDGVLTYWKA